MIRSTLIFFALLLHTTIYAQAVPDYEKVYPLHYIDLRIRYDGWKQGYVEAGLNLYSEMNNGFYRFYENGLFLGYNPWNKGLMVQSSNYFTYLFFSFGGSLGYTYTPNESVHELFFRPQAGLNMNLVQFYYGYTFPFLNGDSWGTRHNLTVSISLASTSEFSRSKAWREIGWGGI